MVAHPCGTRGAIIPPAAERDARRGDVMYAGVEDGAISKLSSGVSKRASNICRRAAVVYAGPVRPQYARLATHCEGPAALVWAASKA